LFLVRHDPEKCEAVFRKDHAQTKKLSCDGVSFNPRAFWQEALGQEKDRPASPLGGSCVQTAGAADLRAPMLQQ